LSDAPPDSSQQVEELVELFELTGATVLLLEPETWRARPLGKAGRALVNIAATDNEDFSTAVPVKERRAFLSALEATLRDSRARMLEHGLRVHGGAERRYRTTLRLSEDDITAVMLDVTASHHNERQWRDVESWLATLAETLPFDFWICDAEGRCVLQNPASARRVGHLLGQLPVEALKPEISRAHYEQAHARAMAGEQVREELAYDEAGELRTFSRVVAPVTTDGQVSGVVGLDLDITEMKQAQDALLRRERLAELGVMAAVVAHEVRNPLGSISNALALVRRRVELNDEGHSLCRIMEDEVQRLDSMVVSLLDFARPMSATLERRPLVPVVDDALAQSLRAEPNTERIKIIRHVDDSLEAVPMDARLVNMALTNLFRNALQAINGEGELHVAVGREEGPEGTWARVSIRDTGPGLPAEVKERLFEPFFTTRSTGSGLGLTIVRRAIDAHRGQVDLSSGGDTGTTCVIRLPLARSD
jgi:PAS domain S-box-containing protein